MNKLLIGTLLLAHSAVFASDIVLSSKIEKQLTLKIQEDLKVLKSLSFKEEAESETLKLLKIKELTADSLSAWIHKRVNYIVEESYLGKSQNSFGDNVFLAEKNVSYPHPNIYPHSVKDLFSENTGTMSTMQNTGSSIYLTGKFEKKLYGITISQDLIQTPLKVLVKSPRVGLIQIGTGLFHPLGSINPNDEKSLANSLGRIATFAHEARHSDGNGMSAGFGHSKCPAGHAMEGSYSCDENLNGPYSIAASLLLEFVKECQGKCSIREQSSLIMAAFDSQSRVLKTDNKGKPSFEWDETPESLR